MNPQTFVEAKRLFEATKKATTGLTKVHTIVAPPAVFLRDLAKGYKGKVISFGTQNIYWEEEGSYTGEISAHQVADSGATYAIIGHAERRAQGVDNDMVRRKVFAGLKHKLQPIIAVGENEHDQGGVYIETVREQITIGLQEVPQSRYSDVIIAYEPVWAIGAPGAPRADAVHEMMLLVRKILMDTYGSKAMSQIRVIYGGAVNEDNAEEIFSVPDLDGVILGRASLQTHSLRTLLQVANRV